MNRSQLVKQLAEIATKPIGAAVEPAATPAGATRMADAARKAPEGSELFVWLAHAQHDQPLRLMKRGAVDDHRPPESHLYKEPRDKER